jgi:hypothetical protein
MHIKDFEGRFCHFLDILDYRIQPPGRRWPLWGMCYLFEKSKLLFLTDYALKKSLLQGRHPIGCRNALVASFLGQRS